MKARFEVYKNLHKDCWSLRSVKTGLVERHEDAVHITNADFVVQQAGRAKVLRTGRKNVHAMIRGELNSGDVFAGEGWRAIWNRRVAYNPYKAGYFYDVETGLPVTLSPNVVLDANGHVFIKDDGYKMVNVIVGHWMVAMDEDGNLWDEGQKIGKKKDYLRWWAKIERAWLLGLRREE